MAATKYPIESKNTREIRKLRRELAKRNSTLTIEEIWQKEREAMEEFRELHT